MLFFSIAGPDFMYNVVHLSQTFVDNLAQENRDLGPLVQDAMDHALGLRDQADQLDT